MIDSLNKGERTMSNAGTRKKPGASERKTAKMTLYLTPALRKRLRFQALREDKSATALVESLITIYLDEKSDARKTRRRNRGE
jgi:hypothetical protein